MVRGEFYRQKGWRMTARRRRGNLTTRRGRWMMTAGRGGGSLTSFKSLKFMTRTFFYDTIEKGYRRREMSMTLGKMLEKHCGDVRRVDKKT